MGGLIKIKQRHTIIPVKVKDIIRFEGGKGNCCYIYLANGTSYKLTGNIGDWEKVKEIADSGLFIRVHNSHLINWIQVFSYHKIDGVVMNDKSNVPLSEEGFEALDKLIFSEEQIASDIYTAFIHDRRMTFQPREPEAEDGIIRNDEEE